MRDFLAYAEFEGFWARFHPETPSGRDAKERLEVLTDRVALEALYDRTEVALALLDRLEDDRVRRSQVQHHLKRIPRFPLEPRTLYGEIELFAIKKFLYNVQCLVDLVDAPTREAFGLGFASQALLGMLDEGRQSAESFYIADAYDLRLGEVRGALRTDGEALEALRAARETAIRERFGLDFASRSFVLVGRAALGDPLAAGELLLVEPYDDRSVAVRPRPCAEELVLRERREQLLARERALEEEILERLSHHVRAELPRLGAYLEAVTAFDLAYARARLAREVGLVRPVLGGGPVSIQAGRFLPCEATCRDFGTEYTPLEATFDQRATVIFGSNMGGKTIVLKTLAFLQLCAQTGLFVPAAAFRTRVFRHLHYVGEGRAREAGRGLSGFGFEIVQFLEAWRTLDEDALLLFDEFARTTHSLEAEALLSGVLGALAARERCVALCATHFRGVARLEGVAYRRMKGLDHGALDLTGTAGDLAARISAINRLMDHRLEPDDGVPRESDALAVALLLGLDPAIGQAARDFYRHAHPLNPDCKE